MATGIPHGTAAGGPGLGRPEDTPGLPPARPGGGWTAWPRERVTDGDWMAVAMNPGGSPGVTVLADAGVSAPVLFRLAVEVITGGILAGVLSAALIRVPVRLAAGTG